MRSRMTRISASRFGAHTSCIRDMEDGGSGGDDDERSTLRASAGRDGGGDRRKSGDHFRFSSLIHLPKRHDRRQSGLLQAQTV